MNNLKIDVKAADKDLKEYFGALTINLDEIGCL